MPALLRELDCLAWETDGSGASHPCVYAPDGRERRGQSQTLLSGAP